MKEVDIDAKIEEDEPESGRVKLKDLLNDGIKNSSNDGSDDVDEEHLLDSVFEEGASDIATDVVIDSEPEEQNNEPVSSDESIETEEEYPSEDEGESSPQMFELKGAISISGDTGQITIEKLEENSEGADAMCEESSPPAEKAGTVVEEAPQELEEVTLSEEVTSEAELEVAPVSEPEPEIALEESERVEEEEGIQPQNCQEEIPKSPEKTMLIDEGEVSCSLDQKMEQDLCYSAKVNISTIDFMSDELLATARTIEQGTQEINEKFSQLARNVKEQGERVEKISEAAGSLEIDGEKMSLSDSLGVINSAINASTDKILFVSKKAMSMVYALEDAMKNLEITETFIDRVQKITKQTNLLALNATIEAARAGEAGKGFEVVADEVRILSKQIASLSEEMSSKITNVVKSVDNSYETLNDVATVDMSDNILVKEKIDSIMEKILSQSSSVAKVMHESAEEAKASSDVISGMVMEMQFSDKASQYISNIVSTLGVVKEDLIKNHDASLRLSGLPVDSTKIDVELADEVLSGLTLSDLKKDFVRYLIDKKYMSNEEADKHIDLANASEEDDDMELF